MAFSPHIWLPFEVAQRMVGHSTRLTTGLYDWGNDNVSRGKSRGLGI
jgi:hypothetical protein